MPIFTSRPEGLTRKVETVPKSKAPKTRTPKDQNPQNQNHRDQNPEKQNLNSDTGEQRPQNADTFRDDTKEEEAGGLRLGRFGPEQLVSLPLPYLTMGVGFWQASCRVAGVMSYPCLAVVQGRVSAMYVLYVVLQAKLAHARRLKGKSKQARQQWYWWELCRTRIAGRVHIPVPSVASLSHTTGRTGRGRGH
jgi:hypothetical protein